MTDKLIIENKITEQKLDEIEEKALERLKEYKKFFGNEAGTILIGSYVLIFIGAMTAMLMLLLLTIPETNKLNTILVGTISILITIGLTQNTNHIRKKIKQYERLIDEIDNIHELSLFVSLTNFSKNFDIDKEFLEDIKEPTDTYINYVLANMLSRSHITKTYTNNEYIGIEYINDDNEKEEVTIKCVLKMEGSGVDVQTLILDEDGKFTLQLP